MQEAPAETRKDIIKMLAEIIGHVAESCEVGGKAASISSVAYAYGPAECAGLAQQLLTLILELLGKTASLSQAPLASAWQFWCFGSLKRVPPGCEVPCLRAATSYAVSISIGAPCLALSFAHAARIPDGHKVAE